MAVVGHAHIAAFVHDSQIAGMQPLLRIDGCIGRRLVGVIANHRAGSAGADLADLADRRDGIVLDPADRIVGPVQRLADRFANILDAIIRVMLGDDRR